MSEDASCRRTRVLAGILQQRGKQEPVKTSVTVSDPHVELDGPPLGLETAYNVLFTQEAVSFVSSLVAAFETRVDQLQTGRLERRCSARQETWLPTLQESVPGDWQVAALPGRLRNRHLDLGDVSPADRDHLVTALSTPVQGVQVDFDDGHCPTWRNQISGLYNVWMCVHGRMAGLPSVEVLPVLMLRPRAWNMLEDRMMVDGRRVPGPLFDFGLLMYHTARTLAACGSGPFFYLSKVEGASEAQLWEDIFCWTEGRLGLLNGTVKACVLIENILSSFELDGILYALKDHSLGLNCGIWDYAASIISKFGERQQFVLPDRGKYVNMERRFLRKYLQLVVSTSHSRGAPATGGMAALLLPSAAQHPQRHAEVVRQVKEAKRREIDEGVDGFMVYDVGLVPYMNELWRDAGPAAVPVSVQVTVDDLLAMPRGGVTSAGLAHNVAVAVLFVRHWLAGQGHFAHRGAVEDSATAEISRSQLWQWIRHGARMEDMDAVVTKSMVRSVVEKFVAECLSANPAASQLDKLRLRTAADILLDVVTKRDFPEFITTYLYEHHAFRQSQHELPSSGAAKTCL